MGRRLQARESHLQMLRQLTMDKTGNSVLSNAVTLDSLGMLLCFSARKYHVDWSFRKLLYNIILSSIPLWQKEKSNAECRETFAFSFFNHLQPALSIVGCAVPITRNLTKPQLEQCVKNAKTNALYRWWNFQSGGSLCHERCLEHSHCHPHMHEHILLCPWCYQQLSQLILGIDKPMPTSLDALGWWSCWRNTLDKDNVKKQGMRKHR
jgi:hypothetical protein